MNASRGYGSLGALIIVLGLVNLSGCAFGTRHAELGYPPAEPEAGGMIAAARAADALTPGCCEIVISVSDMRARTDRIGNVRNTFGMDTADVVTKDDVRAWVEDAFTHELTGAGYTVLPAGSGAENAILLKASITNVHCDAYLTYDGDVLMTVTLSRQDQPDFAKSYEGSGSVGLSWAATAKSYAESLALALEDAIAQVMVDLARFQGT
jgi:uncharacterized lipoprotein YajG